VLGTASLLAQGNYVYVNNQSIANSIEGYSVAVNGTLTPLPSSPFLTGGNGASTTCYGVDRIVVSRANNLLFVSNGADQTISTLKIDPATGNLSLAGVPVFSGLTLDSCGGISLAATPDGKFLMAASNGQITVFSITATGTLAAVSTQPNCCSPISGMKISSNGQLLAVANPNGVSMFTITPDGSLREVSGSPYAATGFGAISGLEFSCSADRLYGGEAISTSAETDAWSIDQNGGLIPITGSPFSTLRGDSNVVLLSPDNSYLFQSNQFTDSVTSFSVAPDGSLSDLGGFGGVGFLHQPAGLATDFGGTFLYIADDSVGLAVMRINGKGTLTKVVSHPFTRAGEIQGVAAYPPRSCSRADLSLSQTISPPTAAPGGQITLTTTITNHGPDSASAKITDKLSSHLTFVSCAATGGGVCAATGLPATTLTATFPALSSGQSQTVTIVATIDASLLNSTVVTNTASIDNKSAVDQNPADNAASASITISGLVAGTHLAIAPETASYGGSSLMTARLTNVTDNTPVPNRTVVFAVNGSVVGSAITDLSGNATASANLSLISVGTHPGMITSSFAGDPNFASTSSAGDLTVTPATLTVVPGNVARLYGDPNPTIPMNVSGYVAGDTPSVLTGSPSCTAAADVTSSVGTYPISCTIGTLAADSNHAINLVSSSVLTISPAPLAVRGASITRLYGAANPAFTGTIAGLKNGDAITATFASTATAASSVGTYTIVPSVSDPTGKLANYNLTVNNGVLTINSATLTITINNASRLFGDPNPAFSGAIVGLKNGDIITATYSTTATQTSAVGTYPITATLAGAAGVLGNYAVVSKNGTLSIKSTPVVVSITPIAGSGRSQLFQFDYSDPAGFSSITSTRALIGASASTGGTCAVKFIAAGQTVALNNDSGIGWGTAAVVGSAAAIQNNACSLDVASSSVSGVGNDLVLSLSITFKPNYLGAKTSFGWVDNQFGFNSGFQARGSYLITPPLPSQLSFAPQVVGIHSVAQVLTLTNPAAVSMPIGAFTFNGLNATSFSQTNTCGTTLAAGASCTVGIVVSPAIQGALAASLNIAGVQSIALSGSGIQPQAVLSATSLTFGPQLVRSTSASQTVTLSNGGTAALSITSIAIGGTNVTNFAQSNTCGTSLEVGTSCTIAVSMTPKAAVVLSAKVVIIDSLGTHTVTITGSGIAPKAVLAPTSLVFAPQTVGTVSAAQTVSLTNTGNAPLAITSIAIAGANLTNFAQTNDCPLSLAEGSSCTISVTMKPKAAVALSAQVAVVDALGTQSAAITGSGK
jgi:uncharacterized repeat protein (TIGR01451 family)